MSARAIGSGRLAAFCAFALWVAVPGAAQTRAPIVQGRVVDESGSALPGTVITATHTDTGAASTAVAAADGRYRLDALVPGRYVIEARLAGFQADRLQVDVAPDAVLDRDITLVIAAFSTTVTVTRAAQPLALTPGAVTVLGREAVSGGQRRVSLHESLRAVPGVFAQDRVNFSESFGTRLSIRAPVRGVGIGVRGLQIVQDDIPLTTADGTTQPTNIDLGSTGAIEVMRGPGSVLYGNSAGGVITLQTEAPPSRPLVAETDLQLGSYGYHREQVKLAGSGGRLGYVVNVSRMTTDGFRQHSAAGVRLANTLVHAQVARNTELRGVFNLFDMPFGESPSTLSLADARSRPNTARAAAFDLGLGESSRQGQGGLTVEHRFESGQRLRVTGWGMWRRAWNPIPARVVTLARTGAGLRAEYTGAAVLGTLPAAWVLGFDAARQADDSIDYENLGVGGGTRAQEGARLSDQLERVRSLGPFAHLTVSVAPRWTVIAGVRHDAFVFRADDRLHIDGDQSGRRTMGAVSPSAGVTFAATDRAHVYVNAATAFETPTVQELANRASGEGGFNPDLGPQTLRSVDIGARGTFAREQVRYDVAVYVSTLHDALVQYQRADEVQYFRNAGESSRRGVEALVEWRPRAAVSAQVAYTGQRFRFVRFVTEAGDFAGKREPGAPPHQIVAGLTVRGFGLTSVADWRWIAGYPVNDANTISTWSFHVVDLRVLFDRKWKVFGARPFVGIDNAFDERFNGSTIPNASGGRYFEPAPGRQIHVGVTLGIGQ